MLRNECSKDHAPEADASANRFAAKGFAQCVVAPIESLSAFGAGLGCSRPDGGAKARASRTENARQSLLTGAAVPGVPAQVAAARDLSQPVEVMGPAFCMARALRCG